MTKKNKNIVGSSNVNIDLTEWNAYYQTIQNKQLDPAYEVKVTQQAINSNIQDHFNREQGPGGIKWKPSQRALRDGGKTLTDTAAMRRQIKSRIKPNKKGLNIEYYSDGESKKYSWVHNTGARIKNRSGRLTKMPKRQFAWIDAKTKQEITNAWVYGL